MLRKHNLISITFALIASMVACTLLTETTSAKGWDGKVQGKQLVTPVEVTFDNPEDYDNFLAGKLSLNLILKNTVNSQTIRLGSNVLIENSRLRPTAGVISQQRLRPTAGVIHQQLTINVVIDNMSAPLSEAACGQVTLSAENTAGGVNITLSYSPCGSPSAQRTTGEPIGNIIVKGGKNPGGNLSINVGDSQVVTNEAAAGLSRESSIVIYSGNSKGTGGPKAGGF